MRHTRKSLGCTFSVTFWNRALAATRDPKNTSKLKDNIVGTIIDKNTGQNFTLDGVTADDSLVVCEWSTEWVLVRLRVDAYGCAVKYVAQDTVINYVGLSEGARGETTRV